MDNSNERQRTSLIRNFNETSPDAKFGDILTGKVSFNSLTDEQKTNLAQIFMKSPAKYEDFIAQATYAFEQRKESSTSLSINKEAFHMLNREHEERNIVGRNIELLKTFIDGYRNPTVFQQVAGGYGNLFAPFENGKGGNSMLSQVAQTQRLLAYYTGGGKKKESRPGVDTSIVNEIMGSQMLRGFDNGEIRFQGGNIWSLVDSPGLVPAYSGFGTDVQGYLEKFKEFSSRMQNPNSSVNGFIALDIETFGDNKTGDWFHVNEIAAHKVRYDRKSGTHVAGETFSYLSKPTAQLKKEMLDVIEGLKQNPLGFATLSEARKRSLIDLMRYSTSNVALNGGIQVNPAQFVTENGNTNVIHSNATDLNMLYSGKSLNERVIMEGFDSYMSHMLSGLSNLESNGQTAREVMEQYNQLVTKNKSMFFVTHNGASFDLPGLEMFGEKIGTPAAMPKNHLDWLKLQQSVFANPYEMHKLLGRGDGVRYEEGPWTVQELRRTFGWDTSMGHIGAYDVGMQGTSGIVLNTMGAIGQQIENGRVELDSEAGLRRKGSDLKFNEQGLRKGERLFAINAVQNWGQGVQDFQGQYVDGELEMLNPQFNRNVLNAETMYTSLGVRKLEGEKYALELLDEETGTYSYIIREGREARAQISQFVQQHLNTADDMIAEGYAAIQDANLTDRARRQYENLLGLNQGYTKGFDGAKRIFENVGVFNEHVSGPMGPRTREELESMMNFNSMADGTFNRSEADKFWKMLPRLKSEYGAFTNAIGTIEASMPIGEEMQGWEARELNMQRSLALRRFTSSLDNATGGAHLETRPALPYERFVLEFNDRNSGNTRTLNLKDPTSAYQGVMGYIYEDSNKYDDPSLKKQAAEERYLTLITSLQESRYLSKEDASRMVNDYLDMDEASPAIHGKILAIELANNLEILEYVERDSITSTSLAARKAVENLDTVTVVQLTQDAISFANGVAGAKIVKGNIVQPTMTDEMDKLFQEIDKVNEITKLNPGNRRALGQVLQRFMSAGPLSHHTSIAVTASRDNNLAYLNIFDSSMKESVLGALESGKTPNGVVQIAIPLIGENGTMRYKDMHINARSTLVMGENGIEKISSVQTLANQFDEGLVAKILRRLKDGDVEGAQWLADKTTKSAIENLSGIKRNVGGDNDTFIHKNTVSDLYKQGYIDVVPAMAHDLYGKQGGLERKHFKDSAFDGNNMLRKDITSDDLTLRGMEVIDRKKVTWANGLEEVIGGPVDMSSVKSDHAGGVVGTIAARDATFAGSATPHNRDNSAQLQNSYAFTRDMQESFAGIEDGTYYSFEDLTTTALGKSINEAVLGEDKGTIKIKTALMSEVELNERLHAMRETEEGLALLQQERIVNADGSWNPVRVPTVHEQQLVMNKAIIERLWMEQTKSYDIDANFQIAKELIDENTGGFKVGTQVQRGQLLGLDGNGEPVYFNEAGKGTIILDDKKMAISYKEQAHKLFFDFEKGTFMGDRGFGLKFLEALTGIEGVGAVIGPDIEKHKDFSSLYRGYMNRAAEHINSLEGEERLSAIQRIEEEFLNRNNGELGLRVVDTGDGISIEERWREAGIAEIDNKRFAEMLSDIGVSTGEMSEYSANPTPHLIQDVAIAQVNLYSGTAGEDGGKLRIGPRELDMLKRKGLHETANHIESMLDQIGSSGSGITKMETAKGILDAGRAIEGTYVPGENERVWDAKDFRPTPLTDRNRATYARSILDSEWVKAQNGGEGRGVWVNLPKVSEELSFQMDGKVVDKVFLPYVELQGKGNEVWKQKLQRINEGIIRAAQKVENTPIADTNGLPTTRQTRAAVQGLQTMLDEMTKQIKFDISSSRGFINESVLKAPMPMSTSGLTKIMSPAMSEMTGESLSIVSIEDAKKLGLYEILEKGEDLYVSSSRFPTFHKNALQVTKLRMSEDLPEGYQMMTADIAELLRGDSDGDMTHILGLKDEKIQKELAEHYEKQQLERIGQSVAPSDSNYELETMGNVESRPGISKLYDPSDVNVRYDEYAAKYGKQLVGSASNLNYQYSHMALHYSPTAFGDKQKEYLGAMESFLSGKNGLEQKIISAKHGQNGLMNEDTMNPALDLLEALQQQRWEDALRIDQEMLGGMFTEKADMLRAVTAMEMLHQVVPEEQMKDISRKFGLSGGAPDKIFINGEEKDVTMKMIMDVVNGKLDYRLSSNQTIAGLNRLVGVEEAVPSTVPLEEIFKQEGSPIPQPEVYIPTGGPRVVDVNEIVPEYTERGFAKLGSVLDKVTHSKMGVAGLVAGGVGAGALMLTNLTSADSINLDERPHNDEHMQSSHGNASEGGTARVEQNGSGLNGLRVNVSGTAPGHLSNGQIGNMANQAINSSGIQGNINVKSQDDTTSINRQWIEEQFMQLINSGYAGGS